MDRANQRVGNHGPGQSNLITSLFTLLHHRPIRARHFPDRPCPRRRKWSGGDLFWRPMAGHILFSKFASFCSIHKFLVTKSCADFRAGRTCVSPRFVLQHIFWKAEAGFDCALHYIIDSPFISSGCSSMRRRSVVAGAQCLEAFLFHFDYIDFCRGGLHFDFRICFYHISIWIKLATLIWLWNLRQI